MSDKQIPTEVPLESKSKEELVRIIRRMDEDMQWYVDERNRLLAAQRPEPAQCTCSDLYENTASGPCPKHGVNSEPADLREKARDSKADLHHDLLDFKQAVEYIHACHLEGALDIAVRDVIAAHRAAALADERERCARIAATVPMQAIGENGIRIRIAAAIRTQKG